MLSGVLKVLLLLRHLMSISTFFNALLATGLTLTFLFLLNLCLFLFEARCWIQRARTHSIYSIVKVLGPCFYCTVWRLRWRGGPGFTTLAGWLEAISGGGMKAKRYFIEDVSVLGWLEWNKKRVKEVYLHLPLLITHHSILPTRLLIHSFCKNTNSFRKNKCILYTKITIKLTVMDNISLQDLMWPKLWKNNMSLCFYLNQFSTLCFIHLVCSYLVHQIVGAPLGDLFGKHLLVVRKVLCKIHRGPLI